MGNSCTSKCAKRPWTTNELKTLRHFASEGVDAVYEVLRDRDGNPTRSKGAIQSKAQEMHVSLAPKKAEICHFCRAYPLRPGTSAAKHGYCTRCWNRHLTELRWELESVERTQDEYEAAKKRVQRSRRGKDA